MRIRYGLSTKKINFFTNTEVTDVWKWYRVLSSTEVDNEEKQKANVLLMEESFTWLEDNYYTEDSNSEVAIVVPAVKVGDTQYTNVPGKYSFSTETSSSVTFYYDTVTIYCPEKTIEYKLVTKKYNGLTTTVTSNVTWNDEVYLGLYTYTTPSNNLANRTIISWDTGGTVFYPEKFTGISMITAWFKGYTVIFPVTRTSTKVASSSALKTYERVVGIAMAPNSSGCEFELIFGDGSSLLYTPGTLEERYNIVNNLNELVASV